MEGLMRRGGVALWLVVTAVMLTCAVCKKPVNHKIGGKKGWIDGVNYTEWATTQHFYVGDWLYFVFDKRFYNVLEVNKTNYEQCNDREFIKNVTRGGRDVFELTEPKTYFFISSGGYCFHGMKVAVEVVEDIVPSPPPSPAKNESPVSSGRPLIAVMLAFALIMGIFVFKV